MRYILLLPLVVLVTLITSCTTAPKKETPTSTSAPSAGSSDSSAVDYVALKTFLQLDREKESLGLAEKAFNTCDAGFGFSRSQNCRRQHFVVLNFRLLCRDSEGTISQILTEEDLRPLERRSVRWNLKGAQGVVQTDNDGYGQIITTAAISQRTQRVKIGIGNEFLYMRAGELQKVITPKPWCTQY